MQPSHIKPPTISFCDDDSVYSDGEEVILSQKHLNMSRNEQCYNQDGKKILAFASQHDSSPLSPSLIPTSTNYLTPNYLASQLSSRRVPFISPEQAVYQSRAHEPISLTPMERNDMNCPPRQQPQPATFSVLKQCAPLNTKHILPWESPADFEETQQSRCETSRASTNTSINTNHQIGLSKKLRCS